MPAERHNDQKEFNSKEEFFKAVRKKQKGWRTALTEGNGKWCIIYRYYYSVDYLVIDKKLMSKDNILYFADDNGVCIKNIDYDESDFSDKDYRYVILGRDINYSSLGDRYKINFMKDTISITPRNGETLLIKKDKDIEKMKEEIKKVYGYEYVHFKRFSVQE